MKDKNVKLVRRVITELAKNEAIQQGARINVHDLYEEKNPNLEGDFLDMKDWYTRNECGTAACLAGWLAHDPRINAAGLTLEKNDEERMEPSYAGSMGMWALRRFLGFSEVANVNLIFGAKHPNTFDSALERLDEAVAREKENNYA